MLSCLELAEKLELAANRVKSELVTPTEALMTLAAADAKARIGHYQDGWAPLAETTLHGWNGHPGKIELGYAPPDNPLLRKGDMRDSIQGLAMRTLFGAEGAVGSNSKIALWQEMGTSRIPPRPFLGPALLHSLDKANVIFGEFALKILR